jgi:hypothetical protein
LEFKITLLVVGELMSELLDVLDDPEVDLDVEPFPRASLEGERRSGNLGLGSCQSVRSKHPMFSSVSESRT